MPFAFALCRRSNSRYAKVLYGIASKVYAVSKSRLTFKVMAAYKKMKYSTVDDRSFISVADVTFNKQIEVESSSSEYKSIEFTPIFPSFALEFARFEERKKIQPVKESGRYPYENFRCPSTIRQYRVDVFDQVGHGVFYVNLDDIKSVSIGLYEKITTVTQAKNGKIYKEGEIGAGVWEFEVLLRLVCNSYEGIYRTQTLAKYMKRMMILAGRHGIHSLMEECRQVVKTANYSVLVGSVVQQWYEGFESSKMDEIIDGNTNIIIRPVRSHIISEMFRFNRLKDLGKFVPSKWLRVLKQRKLAGSTLTPYEVDACIHEHFATSWNLNAAKFIPKSSI